MATSERTTRSRIFDHYHTNNSAAFSPRADTDSDSDCMHSLQRLRQSLANMGFDAPSGSPGPLDGRGSSAVNRAHVPRRPRTTATPLYAARDHQASSRSSSLSASSSSSVTEAASHAIPPHPTRPRTAGRHEAAADAQPQPQPQPPQPSASRRQQKDEEKLSALLSKPSTPASLVKALRAHCKAEEAKGSGSGFDPSVALLRASAALLTKMDKELVGLRRRQAAADTSAEAAAAVAAAAPVPTPSLRDAAKGEEARVAVDLALRENAALRATMDANVARMQAALDKSRREVACLKEEKAALEEAWQLRREDEERVSRHKAPFEPNYLAGEDGMPMVSTRRALHHHRSVASASTVGGGAGGGGEPRSPRAIERVVEDKLQRMRLLGCLTKKGPLTYVTPKKKTMRLCAPPPSGVVRVRVGGGTMPLEEFMEEKGAQYFGLMDDASAASTGTSSPHLQGLLRTPG